MHRQDPISRRPLSVVLRRDGDQLAAEYHRPIYGQVAAARVPWAALGTNVRFGRGQGLDALVQLLDGGGEKDLLSHLTRGQSAHVGDLLFQLLFPDERVWRPVLRALFDETSDDAAKPPRHPVRLRIVTQDPALLGLPWRLTAWRGYWLVDYGWTFEVASGVGYGRPRHVNLALPARVLVIAPQYDGMTEIQTTSHLRDLHEKLGVRYESAQVYREVQSRDDIIKALSGMQPNVIYYYGHADVSEGHVVLLCGGPGQKREPLLIADLRKMMRAESLPQIVFLNGCRTGAVGWQSAGHQLSHEIPLVFAHRTTAWSTYAGELGVRWLAACLTSETHPIEALHALEPEYSRRDFQWATPCVHTSFESWSTTAAHDDVGPDPDAAFRIDREAQRGLVEARLRELVTSKAQRVEALIAYAIPRNLAWKFGWQAVDHIDSAPARYARVQRVGLRFPDDRQHLDTRLRDELRRQLDIGSEESLQHGLRRHAPTARGNERPILWLDWGLFGPRRPEPLRSPPDPPEQPQAPLRKAELREWLRFASHELSRHCPEELRIVSYLAIETEDLKKIEGAVDSFILDQELNRSAYRCTLIDPPLPLLKEPDILHYVQNERNSRCPPGLVYKVARAIYEYTRGAYEAVVELVFQAQAIGWQRLLDRLNPPTQPAGGDDEELS